MFLRTILSCILPTPLRSDIGLKFDGQELSPFLGKGSTFDSLKICGNLDSRKDLLKRVSKGNETSFATTFNILLLMASGPVALFGFKSLISVSISLAVQRIVDNEFSHLL